MTFVKGLLAAALVAGSVFWYVAISVIGKKERERAGLLWMLGAGASIVDRLYAR